MSEGSLEPTVDLHRIAGLVGLRLTTQAEHRRGDDWVCPRIHAVSNAPAHLPGRRYQRFNEIDELGRRRYLDWADADCAA